MTTKLAAEIRCGHTVCDIHGDHSSFIVVEIIKRAWIGFTYNIIIRSACFGNLSFPKLVRADAALELSNWKFLPHTRGSIRKFHRVTAKVEGGYYETDKVWPSLPEWTTMVPPAEAATAQADMTATLEEATTSFRTLNEQFALYHRLASGTPQAIISIDPGGYNTVSDYSGAADDWAPVRVVEAPALSTYWEDDLLA